MKKNLPQQLDRENLSQLPTEELVNMIIEQAIAQGADAKGVSLTESCRQT